MGVQRQTDINKVDYHHKLNDYKLLNKDVEICSKYFDVVPDGNLFTLDDTPIFAVRMRPFGINKIIEMYKNKYHFDTAVLTYKINDNQYTLYSSDSLNMYITQREQLLKFFDFNNVKENEFKGVIIAVCNSDDRLIHAIPFLYGKCDNRKKIIFLDAFYMLDCHSGCIIGANFFQQNISDIDCYCHGITIQADHHSCGIIACDFVKNCLKNKAKIAKKIIKNVKMRSVIHDEFSDKDFVVNVYDLPKELQKFSQLKINQTKEKLFENSKNSNDKKKTANWFSHHIRKLIYRRDPEPYNPDGQIVPDSEIEEKEINTALIEKGHKYADWIINETKMKIDYNSKYWLSVIKEQKEDNIFKKIMKLLKKWQRKMTNNNY